MKITLLLGRGIEGAGNTQFAKMFYKGLKELNHDVELLVSTRIKERNFRKTKIMDDDIDISFYSNQLIDRVNTDLLFILSVPDKKSTQENKEVFQDIITNTTGKRIYVMVDHKRGSLYRNHYYKNEDDFFNNIDHILTHPETGDTDVLKYLTKIGQIDKQYDVGLNLIMHDFDYLNTN